MKCVRICTSKVSFHYDILGTLQQGLHATEIIALTTPWVVVSIFAVALYCKSFFFFQFFFTDKSQLSKKKKEK